MYGTKRCDEIIRLIDETLDSLGVTDSSRPVQLSERGETALAAVEPIAGELAVVGALLPEAAIQAFA